MKEFDPGVLGIVQGAASEDALFTDLESTAAPGSKYMDSVALLSEGLDEAMAEIASDEADVRPLPDGLFAEVDATAEEPLESEASVSLALRLHHLASDAGVSKESELALLEVAGELDRRGLMSPGGWVLADGSPWEREATRVSPEELYGMFLEGSRDIREGECPWKDSSFDDVDTDAEVFAVSIAQFRVQPDADVVGSVARDLRMAGYDLEGWEGFLPRRGIIGLNLSFGTALDEVDADGGAESDEAFMDYAHGEEDDDESVFSEWGEEVEPVEGGEDEGVQYVELIGAGTVGQIIDEDLQDETNPHRVQWEDGRTEWINAADTSKYRMI